MFWHRHFDVTLLLAAIAMMSLQTPIRPPQLSQTSERSFSAVVENSTGTLVVPRMFVSPPLLSIESRLLQMAPVAASVALGAADSGVAVGALDGCEQWGAIADREAGVNSNKIASVGEALGTAADATHAQQQTPEIAEGSKEPQEIATPVYAI